MNRLLVYLTLFLLCADAYAENLPAQLKHQSRNFQLCQKFDFRWSFIIKIAEIGWYSPDCEDDINIINQHNKIVRFYYHKNVNADFFKQSADEYFLLNLENNEEVLRMKQPLDQFNQSYADIKKGDYYDLIHLDNRQLSLYKNKHLLGHSDNSSFSRKYFNIWFGKQPVIKKLKQAFQPR